MSSLFNFKNKKQDSNYHPESLSENSVQLIHKIQVLDENMNEGHWSQEENTQFVIFIHLNIEIFSSKGRRKNLQVFKKLSEIIGSRTPRQCRSHFQKMTNRFGTLIRMRNHWKDHIGPSLYQQRYIQMRQKLLSQKNQPKQASVEDKQFRDAYSQTDDLMCLQTINCKQGNAFMGQFFEYWSQIGWIQGHMNFSLLNSKYYEKLNRFKGEQH